MIVDKKIIKELIPYAGAFLVVLGYLKLALFYNYFNININNYLEFTEVLTLFLNDLLKYAFLMFLGLYLAFITDSKSIVLTLDQHKTEIIETPNFIGRVKKVLLMTKYLTLLSIFISVVLTVVFIWFREAFWDSAFNWGMFPILSIYFIFFYEFKHKYWVIFEKELNPTYSNIILIVSLFSMYILGSVYADVQDVLEKDEMKITFSHYAKTINTDSNLHLIGQTKNYIFLYNAPEMSSFIFKRSEVTNYKITPTNKK